MQPRPCEFRLWQIRATGVAHQAGELCQIQARACNRIERRIDRHTQLSQSLQIMGQRIELAIADQERLERLFRGLLALHECLENCRR